MRADTRKTRTSVGRPPTFPDNAKIKVLVRRNPHREGTYNRNVFDLYRNGMTVRTFLSKCTPKRHGKSPPRSHLAYHVNSNVIAIQERR